MADDLVARNSHKFKDITGNRFGRLVAVRCLGRRQGATGYSRVWWLCQCDCGTEREVAGQALVQGITRSCGCLLKEARHENGKTHGLSHRPEFRIWATMIARCTNPKNDHWKDYGGRGITVCSVWRKDFAVFFANVGPRPSNHHSIDRINNDGNYEPGNVRWATPKEQRSNQRKVEFCRKGHPLTEDNTAIRPRGDGRTYRRCRICERASTRERRARFGRIDRPVRHA
jgi:hypothetical protein